MGLKDDLTAAKDHIAELEAEREDLVMRLEQTEHALKLKPLAPKSDDFGGALPMVLHVGGSELNGTEVKLIRCGVRGELKDKWLVQKGGHMFTTAGQQFGALPYLGIPNSMKGRGHVEWDLRAALAFAKK